MKIEDVLEIIWTIVRRLMKGSLILIMSIGFLGCASVPSRDVATESPEVKELLKGFESTDVEKRISSLEAQMTRVADIMELLAAKDKLLTAEDKAIRESMNSRFTAIRNAMKQINEDIYGGK